MSLARPISLCRLLSVLLAAVLFAPALAQVPGEVTNAAFADTITLEWSVVGGSDYYNVYRGPLAGLSDGGRCHGYEIQATSFTTDDDPALGDGDFFVITAESSIDGEGTAGAGTAGAPRPLLGACTPVLQAHAQDRLGYGKNEWTAVRIAALGLQAYIEEQLDPSDPDISDAINFDLNSRMASIDPPEDLFDLLAQQIVRPVYSHKQLEQQVAAFWANHFNTDWTKVADLYVGAFPDCAVSTSPACDPSFPARGYREASMAVYREMEKFRALAFHGNFRQLLEASQSSAAMIIYLDTISSQAPNGNENYPRELQELHSMGVNGGYTQQDVEEGARIFTGWNLCKKLLADIEDPTAPCLDYWPLLPAGQIVATFVPSWHDCGSKTLYAGTPQQAVIPSTCGSPTDGYLDAGLALDAIAAHPSTKRFISEKILKQFVTDQPSEAMIDVLVTAWNDAGNPNGVGDMREVLRAALTLPEFLDPESVRSKIKTPLEHFVSAFRAIRGDTDGASQVINYLAFSQHIPHFNPVPTGYPEDGESWIDTTNVLIRQNFGLHLAAVSDPLFGSDPLGLLNAHGVSTLPGNQIAIVDFLNDYLFAGTLTAAEKGLVVGWLITSKLGLPSPYDEDRLRKAVGMMLGFAQFQEQ